MDSQEGGRVRQKQRTRTAIVAAAREIVAEGRVPTVTEVAERAGVSRPTAYRYFPDQPSIVMAAAVAGVPDMMEEATRRAEAAGDAEQGLIIYVDACYEQFERHEPHLRLLLSRSLTAPAGRGLDEERTTGIGRQGRRVDWIRRSIAPAREAAGEEAFERLVEALTVLTGLEALAGARDVLGLDLEAWRALTRWAAVALLRESVGGGGLEDQQQD